MKTPDEVAQEIRTFKDDHDSVDNTFAHIVIADFNLSWADILGCFEPDNLHMWAKDQLMNEGDELAIERHYIDTAAAMTFLRYLQDYDDDFLAQVQNILTA